MGGAYLYILGCRDDSYYVGTTRSDLDSRIAEHNAARFSGYTATRRPVRLVFAEHFDVVTDAIIAERRVKGWSRAKKETLIAGNWNRVKLLAQRRRAARGSSG